MARGFAREVFGGAAEVEAFDFFASAALEEEQGLHQSQHHRQSDLLWRLGP